MQNTETPGSTGQPTSSAEELVKQLRKESRRKFLAGIRDSLESVRHQMAFTAAETAVVCGKSPTWSYRRIYNGTFRVISSNGQILIPRSEIEHFLAGAATYNPEDGGEMNGRSSK